MSRQKFDNIESLIKTTQTSYIIVKLLIEEPLSIEHNVNNLKIWLPRDIYKESINLVSDTQDILLY